MLRTIDSINHVLIYELNGKKCRPGENPELIIESHWNDPYRVHVKFGDTDLVVMGRDLEKAVENAMNV